MPCTYQSWTYRVKSREIAAVITSLRGKSCPSFQSNLRPSRPFISARSFRSKPIASKMRSKLFSHMISTTAKRRSEEHTSELQSLMRISYAVFCLKKKNIPQYIHYNFHNNYHYYSVHTLPINTLIFITLH